jgi:gamma-glutamyltranspeptidase / glutathione hydrolase
MVYEAKSKEGYAIDFREKAPHAAYQDMFLTKSGEVDNQKSRESLASVGVPGTVAGLELVREMFGSLPRKILVKPAIKLARKGVDVTRDMAESLAAASEGFSKSPESMSIFMPNGSTLKEGERLVQKNLANSLSHISKYGQDAFYKGELSKKIVSFMQSNDGLISQQDLLDYTAIIRKPIKGDYKGYRIYTMPPPSSGGIHLVQFSPKYSHCGRSYEGCLCG